MDLKKVVFLNVPVHIVPPDELSGVIARLLNDQQKPSGVSPAKGRNIVLLSLADLLRARRNNEYRNYVLNAALVLPISKSIVTGIRFLTEREVFRYMPFDFVITLLSLLEKQEQSLYLLGGKKRILRKAEKNIHATFPRLKIVGRHHGSMRKGEESAVKEAIRKSSPSLLLAGKGIRKNELWIYRNSAGINSGLRFWCSDLLKVFADKKRRPSYAVFEKGLDGLVFCLRNPFRLFRIFPFLRYNILLLIYRVFKW